MPSKKDLSGTIWGRLHVIGDSGHRRSGKVMWLCRCECGAITLADGTNLQTGNTRSCGCLHKEVVADLCVSRSNTYRDFMSKIDQRQRHQCWLWRGATKIGKHKYGKFTWHNKTVIAHRLSYMLHNGVHESELGSRLVMHTCDNPQCCNPDHLISGTCLENVQDCVNKGRRYQGVKHVR